MSGVPYKRRLHSDAAALAIELGAPPRARRNGIPHYTLPMIPDCANGRVIADSRRRTHTVRAAPAPSEHCGVPSEDLGVPPARARVDVAAVAAQPALFLGNARSGPGHAPIGHPWRGSGSRRSLGQRVRWPCSDRRAREHGWGENKTRVLAGSCSVTRRRSQT